MEDYKTKYEKVIEQAKKELQACGSLDCDAARQIFRFFPELKKSEDERIKKEIIQFLQLSHPQFVGKRNQKKWIAWLEKQDQNKHEEELENAYKCADEVQYIRGYEDAKREFESQGEQNNKHLYDVIIALWDLLDKIDTFSDLQIDDTNPDNPFKKIEYIAQERHKFVKSDGYNLYIQGEQITDFKQSKQKPADKCIGCNNFKGCITCTDGNQYAHITEQKTTDNLEPKFKVGDWVVWDNKISCHIDNIYQGKESLMYTITDTHNMTRSYSVKGFDSNARLWTIQDAKDGDVLAFDSEYKGNRMVQVGIIKKYVGKHGGCSNTFNIYVGVNWDNNLQIDEYMGCSDIRPATKEQRDLLFVKLKEAGYEWDVEKKELKKIEQTYFQKQEWTSYDEKAYEIALLDIDKSPSITKNDSINWLKSLKERVQPQPKQEWSEEDEIWIDRACMLFDELNHLSTLTLAKIPHNLNDIINYLKSLKERYSWKPSDEQMDAVKSAALDVAKFSLRSEQLRLENELYYKALISLYNDLKKLREEI